MTATTPCTRAPGLTNPVSVTLTLVALAALTMPAIATASLLNDTVAASLVAGPDTVFDTTAIVVDDTANPEFSGETSVPNEEGSRSAWDLDVLAEGFTLKASCTSDSFNFDCLDPLVDLGVVLNLSDLDWLPIPGKITDVLITEALQFDDPDGNPAGTPIDVTATVLSPSAVQLSFVVMDFGTGAGSEISIIGAFEHAPVPEPAPLALLLLGAPLVPLLARRSHRAS